MAASPEEIVYPLDARVKEVEFSYRIEGFYSVEGRESVEINIKGTGDGSYRITYYGKVREERGTFSVSQEKIREFVSLYKEMDFLKMEVVDLNEPQVVVTDTGMTTISYKFRDKQRTISYGYAADPRLRKLCTLFRKILLEARKKK